ncbi:MAG: transcription factor S [Candidatus Korarchaeota archaeon]
MKFCDKCGGIMKITERDYHRVAECTKCGNQIDLTEDTEKSLEEQFVVRQKIDSKKYGTRVISGSEVRKMSVESIVRIECPKCKNMEAYSWQMQTRSADEGATTFYKCTKCGYSWREY